MQEVVANLRGTDDARSLARSGASYRWENPCRSLLSFSLSRQDLVTLRRPREKDFYTLRIWSSRARKGHVRCKEAREVNTTYSICCKWAKC